MTVTFKGAFRLPSLFCNIFLCYFVNHSYSKLRNIAHLPRVLLDRIRLFQQLWQLSFLGLQLRVTTDMLVIDEDIRNRALMGDVLEGILDGCTVVCNIMARQQARASSKPFLRTYRLDRAR